jgi:hypothetical protein
MARMSSLHNIKAYLPFFTPDAAKQLPVSLEFIIDEPREGFFSSQL